MADDKKISQLPPGGPIVPSDKLLVNRNNLSDMLARLGSMSNQNSNAVTITGGSAAFTGTVNASNLNGTNTGNQSTTLTGDITGTGTNTVATVIANNAVSLPEIQNIPSQSLLGNSTSSAGAVNAVIPSNGLGLSTTNALQLTPIPGRTTSGNTTLILSDHNKSLISSDSADIFYILPTGLPEGFRIRSYQGSTGQISYIAQTGAVVLDGNLKSLGTYTNGYFVDIENLGNDTWVVMGNTQVGIQDWRVFSQPTVREGDSTTFVIQYPDDVNYYVNGATIVVIGTGFSSAGLDTTLIQAIENYVKINPTVSWDGGTNTLTVRPGTKNPIALGFFATPTYTTTSNRTVSITISSPSVGTIGSASASTLITNNSRPITPAELFPQVAVTTLSISASGQKQISLADATGILKTSTVYGVGIPAQTWITSVSGNTITLSNDLTSTIAAGTQLNVTPPGFWFDFSSSSNMSLNGSNQVASVSDSLNGYTVTESNNGFKPTYTANSLNSLGGIHFNNDQRLRMTAPGGINKTLAVAAPNSATTLTLSDVTNLTVGMLIVDNANKNLDANVTIASIAGNVVTMNKPLFSFVSFSVGTVFTFYPVGTNHPLCSWRDPVKCKATYIAVVKKIGAVSSTGAFAASNNFSFNYQVSGTFGGVLGSSLVPALAVDQPIQYMLLHSGNNTHCYTNNQLFVHKVILTADWVNGTSAAQVNDNSGLRNPGATILSPVSGLSANNSPQATAASGNSTVLNATAGGTPTTTIPAGTELQLVYGPGGANLPQSSQEKQSSWFDIGSVKFNMGQFAVYELIAVPRLLSPQERHGIAMYLSNKWGITTTQTAGANASAGATRIQLSALTGVTQGQSITGTGIAPNTCVLSVNTFTNFINLDTPIIAPGVTNGDTLSFKTPAAKKPRVLDINDFEPTFRDDFSNGLKLFDGTSGWVPYYGDPSYGIPNGQPPYNSAYGLAGHGSTNNIGSSGEIQWYLDILNWQPWLKYNPFSRQTDKGSETGGLLITATPVSLNPGLGDQIGYTVPSSFFKYTSGYITGRQQFWQQYGYYEAKVKYMNILGGWPAFWLTAKDGVWPPEIDVSEGYGYHPDVLYITTHANTNKNNVGSNRSVGDALIYSPITDEYAILGVEITPTSLDFYVNREYLRSQAMQYDFHIYWYMQLNLAIQNFSNADLVTPQKMWVDYCAAWKRKPQTPTIPTATQSETTALLTAMSVQPDAGRQTVINTLISSLKTYKSSFGPSLWSCLDFLFIPAAHDAQAARINWKNPAQIGTVVGSPVFVTDRGYTGSNNVNYINTGLSLSTAGFLLENTSNHIGARAKNLTSTSENVVGSANFFMRLSTVSMNGVNLNNTSQTTWNCSLANSPTSGYYTSVRNVQHRTLFRNGIGLENGIQNGTAAGVALDSSPILFANGAAQVQIVHGGVYLSPDDVEYLNTLFLNYLTAIGAA